MSDKKNIINKRVLAISLAIIAIVITISITIISLGIGIDIFSAQAPAEREAPKVAALQLNKLNTKGLKLDQKLVGNDLNADARLVMLELKHKQLVAWDLGKQEKQLLVSVLGNSKSLLLNELNSDQHSLDLVSLNTLLKLQPSLSDLG
jgi:hypothetical protein